MNRIPMKFYTPKVTHNPILTDDPILRSAGYETKQPISTDNQSKYTVYGTDFDLFNKY